MKKTIGLGVLMLTAVAAFAKPAVFERPAYNAPVAYSQPAIYQKANAYTVRKEEVVVVHRNHRPVRREIRNTRDHR